MLSRTIPLGARILSPSSSTTIRPLAGHAVSLQSRRVAASVGGSSSASQPSNSQSAPTRSPRRQRMKPVSISPRPPRDATAAEKSTGHDSPPSQEELDLVRHIESNFDALCSPTRPSAAELEAALSHYLELFVSPSSAIFSPSDYSSMAVTVARQQQPHRLLQTLRFFAQVDCPTVDPSTFDQLLERLLLHHRHIGEGNKTALHSLGRLPLDDLPEKAIVDLFLSLVEASRSVDASLALTYAFIDTFPTETTPVVPQALGSIVRSTARDLRQAFHPAKAFFRLAHSMADIHRLNGPETLQWRRAGRRCPSVKLVDALVRAYVVRLRDLKKREASTKSSGTIAEGVSTEGVKVQGKEVLELVKRFIKEQGNRRRHLTVSDTLELRMASRLLRHEVEDGVVPSQPTKPVAATLPSKPAPEMAEHEPLTKVQQADVGSARKILTKQLNQMLTDAFESGGLPSLLATWPQAREATTRVAVWAHYIRLLLSAGEVDRALDVVCELTRPGAPTTTTTTTTTSSPPGVTLRVLVRMLQRARDRDMVMATGFAKEGEEGPAFSTVKARLEREFPELWEKVWQSVCEHPNKDGVDAAQ